MPDWPRCNSIFEVAGRFRHFLVEGFRLPTNQRHPSQRTEPQYRSTVADAKGKKAKAVAILIDGQRDHRPLK